jgi:hypothetical protein
VLRLWPEQVTVGLFPGRSWIRRHGKMTELASSEPADIAGLAITFDALLAQAAPLHGARLDLVVSNQSARIVALPWQPKLRSQSEWQIYAQAAFDIGGMPLNDSWVCVPAMRRYGEQGLACALPVAWLAALEKTAQHHGARLRTVLPLSAAAYWSPRRWMAAVGSSWLLLEETDHATLLCFNGRRSTIYDTQPAANERGLRQLIQRCLLTGAPARAAVWCAPGSPIVAVLEAVLPDATVQLLSHDYWDRHA